MASSQQRGVQKQSGRRGSFLKPRGAAATSGWARATTDSDRHAAALFTNDYFSDDTSSYFEPPSGAALFGPAGLDNRLPPIAEKRVARPRTALDLSLIDEDQNHSGAMRLDEPASLEAVVAFNRRLVESLEKDAWVYG